jgi:hypothetical protein
MRESSAERRASVPACHSVDALSSAWITPASNDRGESSREAGHCAPED